MYWPKKLGLGSSHSDQKILNIDEVIVKDISRHIEQAKDCWISDRIEHILPIFATHDDVAASQDRQLLGERTLFGFEPRAEFIDTNLSSAKRIDDGDSQGMRERLEELGLEPWEIVHNSTR